MEYDLNYDFTDFDFEKELEDIKQNIKKPNILICGATGVGKSTVVNHIFGKNIATVGAGEPVTRGIHRFEAEDSDVVLFDSEGYEIGDEQQSKFRENIVDFVDVQAKKGVDEHIHLVWYCISAANKRVTDLDLHTIESLREKGVKLCVLITQIDSVTEEELTDLKRVINRQSRDIPLFTVSIEELPEEFLQWDELLQWSIDQLEEQLRNGFVRSLDHSLHKKYDHALEVVIPKYTKLAAGVAATPIPFSDAALLVPMQLKMYMEILHLFGVSNMGNNIKVLLQGTLISKVAKRTSAYLLSVALKLIPGFGTVAGIAINSAVASTFTYGAGRVCLEVTNLYVDKISKGQRTTFEEIFNSIDIDSLIKRFTEEKKEGESD